MYGKQIYKGTLDRTVLGQTKSSGSLARMYNKDELTELFRLDPPGKCESLARMQLGGDKSNEDWKKKCSISQRHKHAVGISRRSDIYNCRSTFKKPAATENTTTIGSESVAVAATGKESVEDCASSELNAKLAALAESPTDITSPAAQLVTPVASPDKSEADETSSSELSIEDL